MPKKKWERPTLIVLIRTKPEEAVLVNCKTSFSEGGTLGFGVCYADAGGGCFPACSVQGVS